MTSLILAIILFLLLSAFFSGVEIAFISANKLGIEVEKERGTRKSKLIASFYASPKSFLGTMLVGNNIALVAFTILASSLLNPRLIPLVGMGAGLLFSSTILITIVILLFGEFLPKVLFRLYSNEILSAMVYPIAFFRKILMPPAWLMTKMSNFLLKYVLRTSVDAAEDAITRLDLQDFVEGTASTSADEIETDMFKNALHLKEVRVVECMVPRNEIIHVDINEDVATLAGVFEESGHSRLLITGEDIDNVLGYVHHQQLLTNPRTIRNAKRDIDFVPETMSAKDLMVKMMRESENITCVVDEFGGTAGMITLEDILEEIFGEIEDEHDEEEYIEEQINAYTYRFSGRLEVDYLNEKYEDIDIPEGDYNTLSGYIVMSSGQIPEQGEEFIMGSYKFSFEMVSETRIETILVTNLDMLKDDS